MKKIFIFFVVIYKKIVSGSLKLIFGGSCRFNPTCSGYAKEAIEKHGAFRGLFLAVKRVSRCHPLGGFGFDPVP